MATGVAKTNYMQAAVLNILRATNVTAPATIYVGLFTATPADAGGGTEVSGGSYARQSIAFGAPVNNTPSSTIANTGTVTFPTATGSWGTITHVALFDALSAGNMLYYGALTTPITISSGGIFSFAVGAFTITED